jgi:hypothetical protein
MSPQWVCLLCLVALALPGGTAWALGPVSIADPLLPWGLATGLCAMAMGLGLPRLVQVPRIRRQVRPSIRRWVAAAGPGVSATGALCLLMLAGTVLSAVATPWGGLTVDRWLAAPEQAIGVTQADVYRWASGAGLLPALALVYGSLAWQIRIGCAWWSFVAGDAWPIWRAAATISLCMLVGLPLYVLLPAEGPATYYGLDVAPSFLDPWRMMRSGLPCSVMLDGYISAPSFHVVISAVLIRLMWRTPLRWASVLVNTLPMWLATWTIGLHFLADLAVGAVLVVGAAYVVDSMERETA